MFFSKLKLFFPPVFSFSSFTPPSLRKMQIKTTLRFHLIPGRMGMILNFTNAAGMWRDGKSYSVGMLTG